MKAALKNWTHNEPGTVIHILDHKYTDVSLRISAMKGADYSRVKALELLANRYNYALFLASMEHEKSGEAEYDDEPWYRRRNYWDEGEDDDDDELHPIGEVLEISTRLKRVVAADEAGTEVFTDVTVYEEELLDGEAFTRDPDSHHYEGYTGNAGAQSTHWYRDTVSRSMFHE